MPPKLRGRTGNQINTPPQPLAEIEVQEPSVEGDNTSISPSLPSSLAPSNPVIERAQEPPTLEALILQQSQTLSAILSFMERFNHPATNDSTASQIPSPPVLEQHSAASSAVITTSAAVHTPPHAPKFRTFKGDHRRSLAFLADMEIQTKRLTNDEDRISETYRFLEGVASEWLNLKYREQREKKQPLQVLHDWDFFRKEFLKRFTPLDAKLVARQRLDRIKHDPTRDINEYLNKFDEPRAILEEWGDAAFCHFLVKNLEEKTKKRVYDIKRNLNMEDYADATRCILEADNQLKESPWR